MVHKIPEVLAVAMFFEILNNLCMENLMKYNQGRVSLVDLTPLAVRFASWRNSQVCERAVFRGLRAPASLKLGGCRRGRAEFLLDPVKVRLDRAALNIYLYG